MNNPRPFTLKDFSRVEPVTADDGFMPIYPKAVSEQDIPEMIVESAPLLSRGINEEELEQVRRSAFEEGREQGHREAGETLDMNVRQQQEQLTMLVSTLLERLDTEMTVMEEAREQQRKEVSNLVLLLAKKLAGNALTSQPLGAVDPMISECLGMLVGETKLTISVMPDLVEPLREHMANHRRAGQDLEIVGDNLLQPGDCRISWPSGKAERNNEAIWREIEKIVSRALAPSDQAAKIM